MKIQAFLFFAAFLLFTAFVQETEGFGTLPPGKRNLDRKFKIAARSLCETARSLDCDGIRLNSSPMKKQSKLISISYI
ncbi:hypothetical protein ACROYT_G016172 [Oculina patagonica]